MVLVLKQICIFFLYCPLFSNQRCTILSTVNDIDSSFINTDDSTLTHILLFGKASSEISANTLELNASTKYIISTNRLEKSLFLAFCNFLLYVHHFNSFPYHKVFFKTRSQSVRIISPIASLKA